jgi:hypothetical protein
MIHPFCQRVYHTPSMLSALLKMGDNMVDKLVLNLADDARTMSSLEQKLMRPVKLGIYLFIL